MDINQQKQYTDRIYTVLFAWNFSQNLMQELIDRDTFPDLTHFTFWKTKGNTQWSNKLKTKFSAHLQWGLIVGTDWALHSCSRFGSYGQMQLDLPDSHHCRMKAKKWTMSQKFIKVTGEGNLKEQLKRYSKREKQRCKFTSVMNLSRWVYFSLKELT